MPKFAVAKSCIPLLLLMLLTACASAPPSGQRPSIGLDPTTRFTDQIGPGTTSALDGHSIEYTYVTGSTYQLSFDDGKMTAREVGSDRTPVIRDYLARKIGDGMYFVHWMAINREGHISLVVDIRNNAVHGAAVLPNGMQIFDTGVLNQTSRQD